MKKRILLVEDDPSVLKVTKARLEHEGFDVVTAMDGNQALEVAAHELPIHLILLDIMLPKRNGYEVCSMLKRRPMTSKIPVIVFTASESQLQRLADRCVELGATDWIKKPFTSAELMAKVHRALGPACAEPDHPGGGGRGRQGGGR